MENNSCSQFLKPVTELIYDTHSPIIYLLVLCSGYTECTAHLKQRNKQKKSVELFCHWVTLQRGIHNQKNYTK